MKLFVLHVLKFPSRIILILICVKNYRDNLSKFSDLWRKNIHVRYPWVCFWTCPSQSSAC